MPVGGNDKLAAFHRRIRGSGSRRPASLMPEVRASVASVEGDAPIYSVRTLDEILAESTAPTSFALAMLGLAAGTALFFGIVGVYDVISYAVGQRTHEIGVRVHWAPAGRPSARWC